MNTRSEQLGRDFDFTLMHLGLSLKVNWPCDKWAAIIEGESFDYFTGIGHRKAKRSLTVNAEGAFKAHMSRPSERWTYAHLQDFERVSAIKDKPTLDDILHSLVSDASSAIDTFEDWCGNFGYDTDSRKALAVYEACQNTIKRLRKIGVQDLDEANEAFQDY